MVDKYASRHFIEHDSQASVKNSVSLKYDKIDYRERCFESAKAELAVSYPQWIKLSYSRAQGMDFLKNKLTFSYYAQLGHMHNLTSGKTLHANDRFFLNKTHSFQVLGHCEPSNYPVERPINKKKIEAANKDEPARE